MEWSKIKNIIILILVFLNVFLLALVITREGKNARNQEETRTGVVAALEKNGIAFLPDEVPEDLKLGLLSVTRSRSDEQTMAEALLGPVEREDTGGSVRVVYTGTGGMASFTSDGRFEFELTELAGFADGGSLLDTAADCLARLGLQADFVEMRVEGEDTLIVYRQNWEGVPLFSCQVTVICREDAPYRIVGEWLAGSAVETAGELLDTPTVLLRFLAGMNGAGNVCSRIDDMTAGYQSSVNAARPVVQLTPVWCITTDTGVYYVDAVTGELSLAE